MYVQQIDVWEVLGEEKQLTRAEALFREAVQLGSGFDRGKERIREAARVYRDQFDTFCKALVGEYGTGGHSMRSHAFLDYDSKGIKIADWDDKHDDPENGIWNEPAIYRYSWPQVAKEILRQIACGEY